MKTPLTLERTIAGWFLLSVALFELLFYRLASYMGYYIGVGAEGPVSSLVIAGEVAVNAVGIMSLFILCASLTRLMSSTEAKGMWWRAALVLLSPSYLLIIAWSVFRSNLSPWLILAAYITTILSAVFIVVPMLFSNLRDGPKRVATAFIMSTVLQAFAWISLDFFELDRFSDLGSVTIRSFLVAEVLATVTPIVAFFVLFIETPARLGAFIRRPHLPALAGAIAFTALGVAITFKVGGNTGMLSQLAYLVIGITVSIPGGVAVYIVSMFFASLLVGCLILPSKRWKPDADTVRMGLGLAFIWIAGLQPVKVYLFALMLTGYILLTLGLVARFGTNIKNDDCT